jgi:hypothetical protein
MFSRLRRAHAPTSTRWISGGRHNRGPVFLFDDRNETVRRLRETTGNFIHSASDPTTACSGQSYSPVTSGAQSSPQSHFDLLSVAARLEIDHIPLHAIQITTRHFAA